MNAATQAALDPEQSPSPVKPPGVVGSNISIKGVVVSHEDLYFDGEVEGSIEALESMVTVGPNARLEASIKARKVVVLGSVHGIIEAFESIELRRTSKLVGDVKTSRIVVEDGAFFKGSIDTRGDKTDILLSGRR